MSFFGAGPASTVEVLWTYGLLADETVRAMDGSSCASCRLKSVV